MLTQEKLFTTEEFWDYVGFAENVDRRFELEDGVLIEMPPSRPINTIVASRMGYFLNAYVLPKSLGHVTQSDGGFRLGARHVRQPDVAFVASGRFESIPESFDFAPDWAIEVVSPNEDVLKKVNEYLDSGTRLVWAIYPDEKVVHVFFVSEDGRQWERFGVGDTLTGGEVLPDFHLACADIFPE